MPTTNHYGIRYPSGTDSPNGAPQMQQLATDVDTALNGVDVAVQSIPKVAAGQVSITPTTSRTLDWGGSFKYGNTTVTFPAGYFSSAPSVVISANSSVPGIVIEATPSNVSATGFTANLARTDSTATIIYWQAIQQTQ